LIRLPVYFGVKSQNFVRLPVRLLKKYTAVILLPTLVAGVIGEAEISVVAAALNAGAGAARDAPRGISDANEGVEGVAGHCRRGERGWSVGYLG
jgi:hypothetical protein